MDTICSHSWKVGCGFDSRPCVYCQESLNRNVRCKYKYCYVEACIICVEPKFKITFSKTVALTLFTYEQVIAIEKKIGAIEVRVAVLENQNFLQQQLQQQRNKDKGKNVVINEEESTLAQLEKNYEKYRIIEQLYLQSRAKFKEYFSS